MKIGDIEIYPLYFGKMKVCGGPVFGIIPKKIWNKYVKCDSENKITITLNSLLIVKNKEGVILDTGFGSKMNEKTKKAYGVEDEKTVPEALKRYNYYVGDITHCVLTHLHADHCGGCTKYEGGKVVAKFPNAKYYIQEKEYDDAVSPTYRTKATYLPENFEPLYEEKKLILLNGISNITPFISVHPVDGHVNAMNIIQIKTKERNIYFPGDLIGQKEHVHPLWNTAYDYYPLKSEENKIHLLETCIEEDAWLFLAHEPDMKFYKVIKYGDYKYELKPIDM